MRIDILPDAAAVAKRAAGILASEARAAVQSRGRFLLAVSGGHTPWQMLRALADEDVPWPNTHLFQIDERVAPAGHPERNLAHLRESLRAVTALPEANLHAMPVEDADLDGAAGRYADTLAAVAGLPAILDVAHLGLGPDGHTASLVPGDPALDVADRDVAVTGVYQNRRRMTLTYPCLDRARKILWLVTGDGKAGVLRKLLDGDRSIPAGRVRQADAFVLTDCVLQPR